MLSYCSLNDFLAFLEVSYNAPKLPASATWNENAITFADASTIVTPPTGIFLNTMNTVYAVTSGLTSVLVWSEGSAYPTRNTSSNLNASYAVFVTTKGDIYADNGYCNNRIEKWTVNASNSITAMDVIGRCGGLFVDGYDSMYCSLPNFHQVVRRPIDTVDNSTVIVAGTGAYALGPDVLWSPYGIFVDIDLSLYVADAGNHRIQRFRSGQSNGTTVAGNGASGTITLSYATGVVLDGDGYIFISDHALHRIVGSGPRGFRCVAGCTGASGSAANQMMNPYDLSFDSYGNLYVADSNNYRIQKFVLAADAYGELSETQKFLIGTIIEETRLRHWALCKAHEPLLMHRK